MAYPNPDYDPDWKERHDLHAAERDRAQQEERRLIEAGKMDSDAYTLAHARWQRHHKACLEAIVSQHKTIQDYAAWRFQSAPPDIGFEDVSVILPVVDFESLTTIAAVNAAWARVHGIAKDTATDRRGSLPVGQPLGMLAFADAASPRLTRGWRQFTPRDLYPVGYPGTLSAWALVTIDEQGDGWHICFGRRWGSSGHVVSDVIDRLATAIYREAQAIAAKQAPERTRFASWIKQLFGGKSERFSPDRFHFYEHSPTSPDGVIRESFARAVLTLENGEFTKVQWQSYPVIPSAIQSARMDLARNGTGGDHANPLEITSDPSSE